ncbi:MAG: T9SS type A sorting domain-containing protein [Bacteroidetes bacterium]|nr:T9SS type A sorting domain-containing protein [Bacteroidota bacterium]
MSLYSYNTMHAEAEGQLKEVERNFERYGKMDSTFIPMLNNIDSLVNVYNYYKAHFDEMRDSIEHLGMNADSLKEAWYVQIENLDITRANIVMQHNAVITGEMYEGELTNNIIQPEEVPEYNSARLNEIFMILEDVSYSNIDEYYTELLSIAEQCPYYGGEGVYRARAMLYLINDTLQYNDDANCLLYGFYRQGNLSDKYSDETKISIKPNPANTFVRIRVSCSENEMFTAKIINAVGQEVLETNLQCNKDNVISTANFQQGIYTVTVKTNSKIQSFKLSIIR